MQCCYSVTTRTNAQNHTTMFRFVHINPFSRLAQTVPSTQLVVNIGKQNCVIYLL